MRDEDDVLTRHPDVGTPDKCGACGHETLHGRKAWISAAGRTRQISICGLGAVDADDGLWRECMCTLAERDLDAVRAAHRRMKEEQDNDQDM